MEIKIIHGYFIAGNQHLAIAINVDDPEDVHWFDIDPEVNNNAFIRAIGWAYPGIGTEDDDPGADATPEEEEAIKKFNAKNSFPSTPKEEEREFVDNDTEYGDQYGGIDEDGEYTHPMKEGEGTDA